MKKKTWGISFVICVMLPFAFFERKLVIIMNNLYFLFVLWAVLLNRFSESGNFETSNQLAFTSLFKGFGSLSSIISLCHRNYAFVCRCFQRKIIGKYLITAPHYSWVVIFEPAQMGHSSVVTIWEQLCPDITMWIT